MQGYTPIHHRFWSDGWVRQINALDRYLFMYLLTNGRSGRLGIYELPLDLMASESGIDEKDLRISMLPRLEPKIFYREGWVMIMNYPKHVLGDGPKFWSGFRAAFLELPEKIQALAKSVGYPMDRVYIGYEAVGNRIDKNRIDITPAFLEKNAEPIRIEKTADDGTERERKPKEPYSDNYEKLCVWAENRRGFPFINRKKQYAALKKARVNDISITRLKNRWQELESDSYISEKGIEWPTVVNSFDRRA